MGYKKCLGITKFWVKNIESKKKVLFKFDWKKEFGSKKISAKINWNWKQICKWIFWVEKYLYKKLSPKILVVFAFWDNKHTHTAFQFIMHTHSLCPTLIWLDSSGSALLTRLCWLYSAGSALLGQLCWLSSVFFFTFFLTFSLFTLLTLLAQFSFSLELCN